MQFMKKIILFLIFNFVAMSYALNQSYFDLGYKSYQNNENKKAVFYFHKAINNGDKDAVTYYNLALNYSLLDSFELSNLYYDTALTIYPLFEEAYQQKGVNYLEMGDDSDDFTLAIEMFSKAIMINSESISLYNRGLTYFLLGSYKESIQDLEKSLKIVELSQANRAIVYETLTKSYAKEKELEKSIFYLNKLLDLYNQNSVEVVEAKIWIEASKESSDEKTLLDLFHQLYELDESKKKERVTKLYGELQHR